MHIPVIITRIFWSKTWLAENKSMQNFSPPIIALFAENLFFENNPLYSTTSRHGEAFLILYEILIESEFFLKIQFLLASQSMLQTMHSLLDKIIRG